MRALLIMVFGVLAWSAQSASAAHITPSNFVNSSLIASMDQGTDFNGFPTEQEIENFTGLNVQSYPIQNKDPGVDFGGVDLTVSDKTVSWDLSSFSNPGNLSVYLVFKNDGVADILLATALTGSVTLGHALSNWGLFVEAVPIPAAVWLFGSGLLGLIGFSRRRSNAAISA